VGKLSNITHSQTKFIEYMEQLAEVSDARRDALIAAGCNPELIDSLPDVAAAHKNANRTQEKFKKDRLVITQDRVKYLNNLYKLLSRIDSAAQLVFRTDPARLAKYSLPRPASPDHGTPPEETGTNNPAPDAQQ
jgi:hypothetical protein